MEQNMFGIQQVEITVDKIIIAPVQGYQEQFIRPYDLSVSHDDLNNLEKVVSTALNRPNMAIKPTELVREINLLEPMSTPIAKSEIIGGWGQERAVFLMSVRWIDPYTGTEEVLYLTGYSDYPELNPLTGTVDENMRLYPNTAILLYKVLTPNGPVLKIKDSFTIEYETDSGKLSILRDDSFQDSKLLIRPYDTLSVIENAMEDFNTIPIESSLLDLNTVDRTDLIPVNHLTTTINGILQGSLMNSGTYETDTITYGKLATKKVKLKEIEFFRRLIKELGPTPGLSFPLKWLFKLDKTLTSDRVFVANYMTGDTALQAISTGQAGANENIFNTNLPLVLTSDIGENAGDALLESKLAVLVRDAVSSLLAKNILLDIAFSITNNVPTNEFLFQPYFAFPAVDGVNTVALVEKFKYEFLNLIGPQITRNGRLIVDIDVYSSVTGDTKIAISINGNEKRLYRFPTFADSLYNSLIADKNTFMKVTQDYKALVDQTLMAASANMETAFTAPVNDHFNQF